MALIRPYDSLAYYKIIGEGRIHILEKNPRLKRLSKKRYSLGRYGVELETSMRYDSAEDIAKTIRDEVRYRDEELGKQIDSYKLGTIYSSLSYEEEPLEIGTRSMTYFYLLDQGYKSTAEALRKLRYIRFACRNCIPERKEAFLDVTVKEALRSDRELIVHREDAYLKDIQIGKTRLRLLLSGLSIGTWVLDEEAYKLVKDEPLIENLDLFKKTYEYRGRHVFPIEIEAPRIKTRLYVAVLYVITPDVYFVF